MKKIVLLICISFITLSYGFAQQGSSRATKNSRATKAEIATQSQVKIRVENKEGSQQVRLKNYPHALTFVIRDGQIVSVSHKVKGRLVALTPSASTTGGTDCPCGWNCWEDHVLQQSICVCKSCGGGGHPDSFFDVFVD